jgi:hypothetical protein
MIARKLLFALSLVVTCSSLWAADDSCANPHMPRVGLIVTSQKDSESKEVRQNAVAEEKLREELVKVFPEGRCVVKAWKVFDDPGNYPALKGSEVIEIHATTSFKNPNTVAIAITISVVQGPYIENKLTLYTLPLLIESTRDYSNAAEEVVFLWKDFKQSLTAKPSR